MRALCHIETPQRPQAQCAEKQERCIRRHCRRPDTEKERRI